MKLILVWFYLLAKKNTMGCLPRLNNFLCCISLETGGLIIGWITIVVSFLSLLGSIIILSWIAIDRTQFENPDQNFIGSFTGEKHEKNFAK